MQTSISNRRTLAAQAAAFLGAITLSDLPRPLFCVALCAQCTERPAVIPLADEQGNAIAGGLCRDCIPAQSVEDAGQAAEFAYRSRYVPATLEVVEQIAREAEVIAAPFHQVLTINVLGTSAPFVVSEADSIHQ